MPNRFICQPHNASNSRGFTLIELLIAVALIGILAAIALPVYTSQIMHSHRIDAKAAVLDMTARQERFFALNNQFSEDPDELGYPSLPWDIVTSGSTSFYQLSVTLSVDGQEFEATASPTGSQQRDTDCGKFVMDQTGAKTNRDSADVPIVNSKCW